MNSNSKRRVRFAVDVGGTFTDLIVWDESTGQIRSNKVSTTVEASQGVLELIKKDGVSLDEADLFVHGMTLGLNAVLQKKGARTGLITTRGFRDVLEIARLDRPAMYDMLYKKPPVLVPRPLRLEVGERMDARGNILSPLRTEDVLSAVEVFRRQKVESIAVCLLHSYANPAHEEAIGKILERELPGVYVTLSHHILREYYEYERTMSTVMNGYLQPLVDRYLDNLQSALQRQGFSSSFLLLRSSGGAMSCAEARVAPVFTLMSGPAGGVLGASRLSTLAGFPNLITADGGGTSFDVSLVVKGQPRVTSETVVEGYKLLLPILDIRSIGAGGGSIASVDHGGALQVGPESAGANPGPICYRHGGQQPTVTDAALCLGFLDPGNFLGGELQLDSAAANSAIEEKIARPLRMDVATAASGIFAIAETKMAGAIREITIEKGYDPRDFALLAFGGSGPLFGCNLARRCDIRRVVVPPTPSNFSAWGMLMSDLVHHFSRTLVLDLAAATAEEMEPVFRELEALGNRALDADGVAPAKRQTFRSLDMRYFGQGGHSITAPVDAGAISQDAPAKLEQAFHQLHEATYGHRTDEPVQIVHFRVQAVGHVDKPEVRPVKTGGTDSAHAVVRQCEVYWRDLGKKTSWPIYQRSMLLAGNELAGPAIVEEPAATTILGPGDKLKVDLYGNLVIAIEPFQSR